jgi:hypothetical protein
MGPSIRYLVSSPYGDITADENKWDLPLEGDELKTPYKVYFHSIKDFLSQDEFKLFLSSISQKLAKEVHLNEIHEIIIRTEKHGLLYHPASVEVILTQDRVNPVRKSRALNPTLSGSKDGYLYSSPPQEAGLSNGVKFGLNVAISEIGKDWIREEFSVLKRLNTKFNLPYLPEPYFLGELNSILFLLEDWFEGYHEFHISKDEKGKQRLKLWDFDSGYKYLSPEQSFELYKQASKILTLYYDLKDYSQILHWHHAAGDFVVKIEDKVTGHPHPTPPPSRGREDRESLPSRERADRGRPLSRKSESISFADKYSPSTGGRGSGGGGIDVRLTTARRYEPFTGFVEKDTINPILAICYYLLDLTMRMRLDKLDGLGEVVWADDNCVEATLTGFFEALKLKVDLKHHLGQTEDFAILLRLFTPEELKTIFDPLTDHYRGTADFPVIISNLDKHIDEMHTTLQNLLL